MLKTYLLEEDAEYHVRGLVRELDEEINAVRRELKNLEAIGLLSSKRSGNKLIYKLKDNCIYENDLRQLLRKDSSESFIIHRKIAKLEGVEAALLTNSYLKNEYEDQNDIDLLIIGKVDINKLKKALKEIEKSIDRELRTTLLSKSDLEFQIKKRDKFLLDILREDKIILIGTEQDLL